MPAREGRYLKRRFGLGPGGFCVCPVCGEHTPHQTSIPCMKQVCPKCGKPMSRPMNIDNIIETAEANFKDRQRSQLPIKKSIQSNRSELKVKTATLGAPVARAQNLPPKKTTLITPEQIKPSQKIIDTSQDTKRIKTGLVDANKGKIAEVEKNIGNESIKNISEEPKIKSTMDVKTNASKINLEKKLNISDISKKLSQAVKNTQTAFSKMKGTKAGKIAIGVGSVAIGGMGGVGLASKQASELKK